MAKDKGITFERQGLRLVKMVLAMLVPRSLVGDPLVAWKAQLSEAMLVLQLRFVALIYVPPSIFGWDTIWWRRESQFSLLIY